MNRDQDDGQDLAITATDLAHEQFYKELLENSRHRLARLHTRPRIPAAPHITMDILLEETIALHAKHELKQLKKRSQIL